MEGSDTATALKYIFVFFIGLFAGSLANLIIVRVPKQIPLFKKPCCCIHCGGRIKPIDLIPIIGYAEQRGKCRYCKTKISLRFPAVELFTAGMFVLLYLRYALSPQFFAFAYMTVILTAVAFIDIDHRIIPNGLVLSGLAGGIPVIIYHSFDPLPIYGSDGWWEPLMGLLPGTMFLFVIFLLGLLIYKSDDVMGMGDIKLFAPIGLFLGWRVCILALVLAILLAGICSLVLILTGVKKRKDTIPFGPCIVLGTLIAMLAGWDIIIWYFGRGY